MQQLRDISREFINGRSIGRARVKKGIAVRRILMEIEARVYPIETIVVMVRSNGIYLIKPIKGNEKYARFRKRFLV